MNQRAIALPVAHAVLRVLVVLNALSGVAIAILLIAFPTRRWIMTELRLPPSPQADRIVIGLHVIAILGMAAIVLSHVVLRRLIAIVDSVRAGDPFVAENANRLQTIAWSLFALQIVSLSISAITRGVPTPLQVNGGFSINGWLAVLLTFLLARVFAAGTVMRNDLEGTV